MNTRLMDRLFSATENGEKSILDQMEKDFSDVRTNGILETDELIMRAYSDGSIEIEDKETGEKTLAEQAEDGNYDLSPVAIQSQQIEGYIHPQEDGVTPGQQQGAPDEDVMSHMSPEQIAAIGLNPQAGYEMTVEENADGCEGCEDEGCDECEDEKEFSVSTDNMAVLKIFSDQEFCERVFSEVIESEETAKVGDLKVEKDPDEENTVIVTSESTGDQAKVTLDDDEMEVTELDSKNFSDEEESAMEYNGDPDQYEGLHVVGVDPMNHVIVDATEYEEDSAMELCQRLQEQGVDAVQVFETEDEARDYAAGLLENLGVEDEEDIDEPQEAQFSDHTIYVTRYYSDHTVYMDRLFSEAANDVEASQSTIEDAIENGDEIETDSEIITPIDAKTAVVEDKENDGEFTKVTIDGDSLDFDSISEDEAEDLTKNLAVGDGEDEDEEEEKEYSDTIYCDEYETKFFSENEYINAYMERLFSDDSDSEEIEDAIESGEEIENDSETITPIDAKTAVIEDKENNEFTKAVMSDDDLDITPISRSEAEDLIENVVVDDKEAEKEYSQIYCDEDEMKYFSEDEEINAYMERLFSDEADSEDIEKAIDNGEEIETDSEIITPIDSKTAVIEDKESDEYSKAVLGEDGFDINPISEDEAEKLTENVATTEGKDEDKNFSYYDEPVLDKFFTDALGMPQEPMEPQVVDAVQDPQTGELIPLEEYQAMQDQMNGAAMGDPNQPQMSVEAIEDKALAAVNQIQAAANEAAATIMNAKAAPIEGQEQQLQEAQFSEEEDYGNYDYDEDERYYSDSQEDTLVSWLNQI